MSETDHRSGHDRPHELSLRAKRFCTKIAALHYARRFCGTNEFFESLAADIDTYTSDTLSNAAEIDPDELFASTPNFEAILTAELERLTAAITDTSTGPEFPDPPEPGASAEQIQAFADSIVRAVNDHNIAIIRRSHDIELLGKILVAFSIARARESDTPWSVIGTALDLSAQAAHKKFSSDEADNLLEQLNHRLNPQPTTTDNTQ